MRTAYQVFQDAVKNEPMELYAVWFDLQKKEYLKTHPNVKLIEGYFANNQERTAFYTWLNARFPS